MNHQRQLDVSKNSRSTHFDPFQHPPQCLAIAINEWICNYRCKQCHTWMQSKERHVDNGNELSIELKVEVLEQFKKLNSHGTVHFYGGEPFLTTMDAILILAKTCQHLNLFNYTVTNASLIRTPEIAERIISAGLKLLVISLDSHRSKLHEYVRGIKGCFESTLESIQLLQQAAQKVNSSFQISINTIIFNQNLDELDTFIEFCRDLGVNNFSGVLLERTFANTNPQQDVFFEKHFWHTPDEKAHAKQRITDIVHQYTDDPFVSFDTTDLKWMFQYIWVFSGRQESLYWECKNPKTSRNLDQRQGARYASHDEWMCL